ncbi:MAG TPA: LysM domain-containing protein [Acidimicrobiales bacterium]|nr:LysM domain-containing protein [Acidimicrobiales bacterium]
MAAVAYPRWEPDVADLCPEPFGPALLPAPTRRQRRVSLRPASRRAVYRRRRIAVLLLATAAVPVGRAGVGLLGGGPLTASGQLPRPASAAVYVVQPGDTLWSIAERLRPGGDPRPLVAALTAELHGSGPVPGEQLNLP